MSVFGFEGVFRPRPCSVCDSSSSIVKEGNAGLDRGELALRQGESAVASRC
ncbi:hypothetical protein G6O69_12490 [Pseudenhygromyxa sp. WMMC2535]|uniref:hypothetical protein n=1 Tax=Pseudenhygromyxa sp. WMMC2535 TaxID=2712867 RepID=UPI001595C43D|nr:hypothetical protein [Pseudenhygromyxa sp. WMMC2535]NVB38651.1 hypothetical protein [Pseudenhygromyxa sp. WMMC2535]